MTGEIKPRFKFGAKGNTIVTVVCIVVLILFLFGGKGTDTADMNGYATTYDADNSGSVKIFDIGTRSKAAIIRHEDGSLTGLAFRKIPLLDRWKVTKESVSFDNDEDRSVWMTVDDGFYQYFIISDGEKLTVEENHGWYGIYSRSLSDAAVALAVAALLTIGKKLWKRRTKNNAKGSIPG